MASRESALRLDRSILKMASLSLQRIIEGIEDIMCDLVFLTAYEILMPSVTSAAARDEAEGQGTQCRQGPDVTIEMRDKLRPWVVVIRSYKYVHLAVRSPAYFRSPALFEAGFVSLIRIPSHTSCSISST